MSESLTRATQDIAFPEVGMVAGEASGDLLGAHVLQALRLQWPQMHATGIGGPRMIQEGFVAHWPSEKLSVFGFLDALKVYRSLSKIRTDAFNQWLAHPPALFIGIDAPDFNFGLETRLKSAGIKTVHVVCPSFWAWRPKRLETLKSAADHVFCLFPFEPELLRPHGIAATFIGHPLAGQIPDCPDRSGARARLGWSDNDTIVAVLPGSRQSEIKYIGPAFLQTVRRLRQQRPHLQFVIPTVPNRRSQLQSLIAQADLVDQIKVIEDDSATALSAADVALVASGTATLEAALYKCPMVIAYKLSPWSWWMLKRMHLQPWVGLPNILAKQFIVPELLQDQAEPEAMCDQVLAWIDNPSRVRDVKAQFLTMHQSLKQNTTQLMQQVFQELVRDPS